MNYLGGDSNKWKFTMDLFGPSWKKNSQKDNGQSFGPNGPKKIHIQYDLVQTFPIFQPDSVDTSNSPNRQL